MGVAAGDHLLAVAPLALAHFGTAAPHPDAHPRPHPHTRPHQGRARLGLIERAARALMCAHGTFRCGRPPRVGVADRLIPPTSAPHRSTSFSSPFEQNDALSRRQRFHNASFYRNSQIVSLILSFYCFRHFSQGISIRTSGNID